MTPSTDHIDDSLLSAVVDDQLSPDEKSQVLAHLEACSACRERLDGLRAVVTLLQSLPDIEPPRDFALGPRLVVDPPNLIRLRRWYTVARAGAASLAAVFVFLSVGALYVDTRTASTSAADVASRPQIASAPAPAAQNAPPAAATPAQRLAVPAQAPQPGAAGAAAARPASSPQADDQVAAATSVRPLPTPIPAPVPTAVAPTAARPDLSSAADSAAPLRTGAVIVGILAVLTLLAALVVKHRLQQAASHF